MVIDAYRQSLEYVADEPPLRIPIQRWRGSQSVTDTQGETMERATVEVAHCISFKHQAPRKELPTLTAEE